MFKSTVRSNECPACYSSNIDRSSPLLFRRFNYELNKVTGMLRGGYQCQGCGHIIQEYDVKIEASLLVQLIIKNIADTSELIYKEARSKETTIERLNKILASGV